MKCKGIVTVSASILIHLLIGSCYSWGGLGNFFISYIRESDSSVDENDGFFIMPIIIFINAFAIYIGALLEKRLNSRIVLAIGFTFYIGGYFLYYLFIDSLKMLYIGVGISGLGIGIAYLPPMKNSWKYFPDYKGTVTGLILFGYGCSGLIFNIIGSTIINPQGLNPLIDGKYYTPEVTKNVPKFTLILIIILLVFGVLGTILIFPLQDEITKMKLHEVTGFKESSNTERVEFDYSETDKDDSSEVDMKVKVIEKSCQSLIETEQPQPLREAFFSREFLYCFFMGLTIFYPYLIVNVNKKFGSKGGIDETFLLVMITFFTLSNAVIRMVFGYIMDKIRFKILYSIINVTIIIASSTIYFTVKNDIIYFIYNIFSGMCLGGHFSCFASFMPKKFGLKNSPELYGILFISYGCISLLGALLSKYLIKELSDYLIVFLVGTALSVSSLIFTLLLPDGKFEYSVESRLKTIIEEKTQNRMKNEL